MKSGTALQLAGIVAAGVAAYWVVRKVSALGGPEKAAKAVVSAVESVAVGGVKGVGETLGIPDTNMDKCRADLAAGDFWEASFSCPLPVYAAAVKAKVFGSSTPSPSDVSGQAAALVGAYSQGGPSTGVYALPVPDQSEAESARLRRGEAKLTAREYAKNLFDMHSGKLPDYWN